MNIEATLFMNADALAVLERHTRINAETGCIEWQGATQNGYGQLTFHGTHYTAHRFAYMVNVGAIPGGLWVLHHCDNRPCINPAHLYAGTCVDNRQDMLKRHRWKHPYATHMSCNSGHVYVDGSFRIAKDGSRVCRICMREHMKNFRQKRKEQNEHSND